METTDKVTKFGNYAHSIIAEAEEKYSDAKSNLEPLDYIAHWTGTFLLMMEEMIENTDTVADLLRCIAVNGMVGHEIVSKSPTGFNALANQMTDLYARKSRDYGNSFDKSMDKWGLPVAAIRIGDKENRLQSLIAKRGEAEVKDESLADTFIDLSCYATMTLMWMDEKRVES